MTSRTIVVIHRLAMVAEGIAAALSRYPWIVPVGVATDAVEGERLARLADAVAIDPDLPGAGLMVRRLSRDGVRIVQLGGDEEDGLRVTLTSPITALVSALVPGGPANPPLSPLTDREQEILELVAHGLAGKQVARHLGISPKTVEKHKTRIYSKLRVPNQAAAVRWAVSGGLIPSTRGVADGTG